MKILEIPLWSKPRIAFTILLHFYQLDPSVILTNPRLYCLSKGEKIASFATIRKHKNASEIKSVFTFPIYRNKGYAKKLIASIVKKEKNVWIICERDLAPFYESIGFRESIHHIPLYLKLLKKYLPFLKLVSMRYSSLPKS